MPETDSSETKGAGITAIRPGKSNAKWFLTTIIAFLVVNFVKENAMVQTITAGQRKQERTISFDGEKQTQNFSFDEEKQTRNFSFDKSSYLLYYPHAGFTNQLFAIIRASELARLTNRTLVLPPVLPHCPDEPKEYGWGCQKHEPVEIAIQRVLKDAKRVASVGREMSAFPSFAEIIDFDSAPAPYSFVDLPDFMDAFAEYHGIDNADAAEKKNLTGEAKIQARIKRRRELEGLVDDEFAVGNMTLQKMMSKSYEGPVSNRDAPTIFLENFRNEDRVAVTASAFNFKLKVKSHTPIWSLRPTEKFVAVLHRIVAQIGTGYVSLHIRFGDWYVSKLETLNQDCGKDSFMVNTFEKIYQMIEDEVGAGRADADGIVYLGSNLNRAKECFDTILGSRKATKVGRNGTVAAGVGNVTTLFDVLAADPRIRDLMGEIRLEENTKASVLDQLLIGLGKVMLTENAMGMGSTFQNMLRVRHKHREDLLSRINNYGKQML